MDCNNKFVTFVSSHLMIAIVIVSYKWKRKPISVKSLSRTVGRKRSLGTDQVIWFHVFCWILIEHHYFHTTAGGVCCSVFVPLVTMWDLHETMVGYWLRCKSEEDLSFEWWSTVIDKLCDIILRNIYVFGFLVGRV